jgi:hypothetical protein
VLLAVETSRDDILLQLLHAKGNPNVKRTVGLMHVVCLWCRPGDVWLPNRADGILGQSFALVRGPG